MNKHNTSSTCSFSNSHGFPAQAAGLLPLFYGVTYFNLTAWHWWRITCCHGPHLRITADTVFVIITKAPQKGKIRPRSAGDSALLWKGSKRTAICCHLYAHRKWQMWNGKGWDRAPLVSCDSFGSEVYEYRFIYLFSWVFWVLNSTPQKHFVTEATKEQL